MLGPVRIESPFFHLIGGNHPSQPSSIEIAWDDRAAITPCFIMAWWPKALRRPASKH